MSYFDEATETLPREQLAALQLGKLQAMMAELWERNKFYTAKWQAAGVSPADIRSMDDLAKLPFTKKGELMDDQAAHGPFPGFAGAERGRHLVPPEKPANAVGAGVAELHDQQQ